MKKEFIPYEQALELKELGFDEPCMFPYFYGNTNYIDSTYIELANYNATEKLVSAVLYQQAFRWFREKYDLFISIFHYENGYSINDLRRFDTYEEAELECLKKLIEIAKNERK